MKDLLEVYYGHSRIGEVKCLDHGIVRLIDCMPRVVPEARNTADHAILEAARISYSSNKQKETSEGGNRGLIRYLMRHKHSTPFEAVEFKFYHKLPIFVARQLVRHRTAQLNEVSGRYSILPKEFFFPTELRAQSKTNKQSSEGVVDAVVAEEFLNYLEGKYEKDYQAYEKAVNGGVGKELARIGLPLSLYTEWVWKINLHNLLHCLSLRCDKHAQAEIRVYADAMLSLIQPLLPFTIEAWEDFHPARSALLLTKLEVEAIKELLASYRFREKTTYGDRLKFPALGKQATKREVEEWKEKMSRLMKLTPEEVHLME